MPPIMDRTAYLTHKQSVFNAKSDIALSTDEITQLLSPSLYEVNQKKIAIEILCPALIKNPLQSVRFLENKGTFHLLFEVLDRQGNAYIVKTSKDLYPSSSYSFLIDAWMEQQLKNWQFATLKILTVDCSREKVPFDFILMEKAVGAPMADFKQDENLYNQSIVQLGTYLAHVHTIVVEQYGLVNPFFNSACPNGFSAHWRDYIYTNLAQHLDYCLQQQILDTKTQQEIQTVFAKNAAVFSDMPPKLLHGDLNDHNVFIRNDAMLVIDWEDAICGDPIFDIALWGTFIHHHERLDYLLSGYQIIASIPDNFYLKYWLYYLRIMLAKTVVRHRFGYYKTDKIPAIERILPPLREVQKLCVSY
jgi:fructosamine-3-kinase